MEELPEDIQMEIRAALKRKQRKLGHEFCPAVETNGQKKDSESKAIIVVDGEKPGCSHWTDDAKSRVTETVSVYDPLALPPYSQVGLATFMTRPIIC